MRLAIYLIVLLTACQPQNDELPATAIAAEWIENAHSDVWVKPAESRLTLYVHPLCCTLTRHSGRLLILGNERVQA